MTRLRAHAGLLRTVAASLALAACGGAETQPIPRDSVGAGGASGSSAGATPFGGAGAHGGSEAAGRSGAASAGRNAGGESGQAAGAGGGENGGMGSTGDGGQGSTGAAGMAVSGSAGMSSVGGGTSGGAGLGPGGAGSSGHGGATTGGNSGTAGSPAGELVAFPGAEGFGRHATGARGGDVYHVTTLNDGGAGSLRDAVSAPNRTVVFDVSGVIHLGERLVFLDHQTIAGQTAPSGGIVVYGNGTSFTNAHHTIVRYMRFRMGKVGESGKDTITIARGHDMIFDHCSISWGRDGNFDLNQESGYELANITLQDSIVAQGLQTHSTGGLMVADGVSVLRSLYIDNNSRNPKARQTTQWVNNVDYDWVASGYILGDTSGRSDGYLVGNYFIPGPETNGGTLDSPTDAYHVFASGNYYDSDKDGVLDGRLLTQGDFGSATWEASPSTDFPKVTELSAEAAFEHVSAHAGASLWRDEVDTYVVAELASLGKSGATISDETSLGLANVVGDIPSGAAPVDSDQDGMPDAWESANGLAPDAAGDRNDDADDDGYTNLEEYLSSLVP